MQRLLPLGILGLLLSGVLGCGSEGGTGASVEPGDPVATVGGVRFSLPTAHRVVVERRGADGWGDARVVFEDPGRECGTVDAIAAGSTVAATVGCDDHFAEDQAPTRSVALVSTDAHAWTHRDLDGEAYATPGLSPRGGRAVWVQGEDLLTWHDGSFRTAPLPTGSPQVVTVDDAGTVLGIGIATSGGRCAVQVRAHGTAATVTTVPVASADQLLCTDAGLSLASPSEIHGDLSGGPGTEFVVRRTTAGQWRLAARPPITSPGLDTYPDDPARAIWNQLTPNTRGDLVAVGSPDRQHVTAQRYDRARQRWTPSRVIYTADGPTCRREVEDSGIVQGATFRLRRVCAGGPVVLRSGTGATWRTGNR